MAVFTIPPTGGDSTESTSSSEALSFVRSGKDANDLYTILTYKRADGTIHSTSVLSGGTSPLYTTRTYTYYAANGITVTSTTVHTLAYDGTSLISETLV